MKNLLYYFLTTIFILCACNSNTRYNNAIIEAEAILNEFPDGAAHIIYSAMDNPEELPDSIKAIFALTIGHAHKNAGKAMVDDSLLLFALDYYKTKNENDKRLLQAYVLASDHMRWKGDKKESRQVAHEGLTKARSIGDERYIMASLISLLQSSERNEGAIYMRQMIDLKAETPGVYEMYNEMGNLYCFAGQNDSAVYFYEKGIELALAAGNDIRAYLTQHNYADALNFMGDPRKAVKLQKEVITYLAEKHSVPTYRFYCQLSGYYMNLHQLDSARYYLDLFHKNPILRKDDVVLDYYYTILNSIYTYLDGGIFDMYGINDNIQTMFVELQKKEKERLEQLENKNRAELHNMKLIIDKQQNRIILIAVLFAVVLFVILILLYIWKRKKELIEKEEELETLKHLLTDVEKNKITTNKDEVFFKQVLLQQLGLIRLVAATPTSQNQELLKQMGRITNKDIEVDSLLVWDDLYQVIDSIYDNFYTNLIKNYGDILLEKEIQLCCLLKANFSTKEISVIAQQSTQTIYQRKTTIRQKLKMDEKEDIPEFLSM